MPPKLTIEQIRTILYDFYNYCLDEQDGELREENIEEYLEQLEGETNEQS